MKRTKLIDQFMRRLFLVIALAAVLVLAGIFLMLLLNGIRAFDTINPVEFFFGADWNPSAYGEPSYGILAMIVSTLMVTGGAMVVAVPLGVGAAAYLSEVAPPRVREFLKPTIELLASIPSVAVGFIGIVLFGPAIAEIFGLNSGLNAINGSILLAFMSLPTIVTVAEDAIQSVPLTFKEASYALGSNKWITLTRVTLPAAFSGIATAIILGIGRALGETMTVLMAAGNVTAMPSSFFDPVRPLTATIAIELGEVPYGTTHYYSLFALGAVLFLMSLAVNIISERISAKRRYKN